MVTKRLWLPCEHESYRLGGDLPLGFWLGNGQSMPALVGEQTPHPGGAATKSARFSKGQQ